MIDYARLISWALVMLAFVLTLSAYITDYMTFALGAPEWANILVHAILGGFTGWHGGRIMALFT